MFIQKRKIEFKVFYNKTKVIVALLKNRDNEIIFKNIQNFAT